MEPTWGALLVVLRNGEGPGFSLNLYLSNLFYRNGPLGSSLVAEGLGFQAFSATARVQFLVRDLRCLKPLGRATEKEKEMVLFIFGGGRSLKEQ